MAKRKAATTAAAARTDLGTLVGTQRAALEGVASKGELAELAARLAREFGPKEHQALKAPEVERGKREEIEALVAQLATAAHAGKKVHLSELGGWPACWPDERREKVGAAELLTTPITAQAEAVTCPRCKKAGDLPSPEETAALHRAEVAAEEGTSGKRKRSSKERRPASEGEPAARAKRQLALKENLTVRLKIKDFEVKGVVRPDGSMSVKGTSYASPHEAANDLAGKLVKYRIDGFQAWRYQDAEGKWRMLRDHA